MKKSNGKIQILNTVMLITISFSSNSDIYRCEVNGTSVFSQMPCSDNAKKIEVDLSPTNSSYENKKSRNKSSTDYEIFDINKKNEMRKLTRNIRKVELKIKKYQNKMNKEINLLKVKASYANNNLAGATYESAMSTQMTAASNKYSTLIDIEHRKLKVLLDQKAKIENSEYNSSNDEVSTEDFIANKKRDRLLLASKNKIKKYNKLMEQELARIKYDTNFAANNLAGATYEEALSKKMNSVIDKYKTLISIENNKLNRLIN